MNLDQINRNDALNVWRRIMKLNEAAQSENYWHYQYSKELDELKKKPKNNSPSILLALIIVGILMFLVYCFLGEGGIVNILGNPSVAIILTVIGVTVGIQVIRKIIYYSGGAHKKYQTELEAKIMSAQNLADESQKKFDDCIEGKRQICRQYSIPMELTSNEGAKYIWRKVTEENFTFAQAYQARREHELWMERRSEEIQRREENEARHKEEMKRLSEIKESLDKIDRYNRTGY